MTRPTPAVPEVDTSRGLDRLGLAALVENLTGRIHHCEALAAFPGPRQRLLRRAGPELP